MSKSEQVEDMKGRRNPNEYEKILGSGELKEDRIRKRRLTKNTKVWSSSREIDKG